MCTVFLKLCIKDHRLPTNELEFIVWQKVLLKMEIEFEMNFSKPTDACKHGTY